MNTICDHNSCTGCGLCAAQCPRDCISMVPDNVFGHLFPKINQDACIDCNLCKNCCPVLHPVDQIMPLTAYAAWSKDESDYKSSTSGGAASVLSRHILSLGGVVYGCAMLPDIDVRHIRIDRVDDICKLKGSKYVQSDVTGIYQQLRNDVREGRLTLFTGTPCQVAAVKNMFKNQPENLILVDLICHGIPSLDMLKKHVHSVAYSSNYDNVFFRDVRGNYVVGIIVNGQVVYKQSLRVPRYKDSYINAFFDGYIFRDSCYHCKYACPNRLSDITIGDFWRLGKRIPADNIPKHPHGCSLMLPSTEKGSKLIKEISPMMYIYERSVEEAVEGNAQLRYPTLQDKRIKMFKAMYPLIGMSAYRIAVLDKYFEYNSKRVVKILLNR